MPEVFAFRPLHYPAGDVSAFVAPPYDVLDASAKDALIEGNASNIVGVDLPHVPPKELGPQSAYDSAAQTLRGWIESGVIGAAERPAIYAYRQTFEFEGATHRRCGMACTVETVAFGPREGGGVLPHEETFSGPKEDRLALMKATSTQLSPIFGLHPDDSGDATRLTRQFMDRLTPDFTATTSDGVKHEVWTIADESDIAGYRAALEGEDVFIADGHHRYNTALNYLAWLESQGEIPATHPARRCMMVLVSMSDEGLAIGPTHRVLGGMADYTIDNFIEAAGSAFAITEIDSGPEGVENAITETASGTDHNVLGLIDFASGRCFVATTKDADPLEPAFGAKPRAWRTLDVAIIQHLIVETICQPKLNAGNPVKWAFPHSIPEVMEIGSGAETGAGGGAGFAQLAVIVRPTPLDAVREISRANELMPQKSTFFYPKLATGLFVNPLA